jgi:hypothetical protein
LEGLFLNNNELSGEIPPEISNLVNLTTLWIYANQLNGEIPENLCNLVNLNWSSPWTGEFYSYIHDNQLCPPYPECIEDYIGYQDTSDCPQGCTDSSACNYIPDMYFDDGSCIYPEENYDCYGNCIAEIDCAGLCGGSSIVDECGVCGGDNTTCADCAGVPNGDSTLDDCGNCDNDSSNDCVNYCLDLHSGANLKSFYALPEDTSMESMMSSLGENTSGVITEGGACSQIDLNTWVGSHCTIHPEHGYWIITTYNDDLCIQNGTLTDPALPYELHAGANLISFSSAGSVPIGDALPDDVEVAVTGVITEGHHQLEQNQQMRMKLDLLQHVTHMEEQGQLVSHFVCISHHYK